MKTGPARLATAAAIGAALLASGCVDNRASIQLRAICAPTDECVFAETCEAQLIGNPALDTVVSARATLSLAIEVANQNPPNGDAQRGRGNTNDAHVDETIIEYDGPALSTAIVGASGLVPAGGTSVIGVDLIPDALDAGTILSGYAGVEPHEMVARFRLRGFYDDGTRFETGEFPVTVSVCAGCFTGTQICAGARTCPSNSNGQLPLACPQ